MLNEVLLRDAESRTDNERRFITAAFATLQRRRGHTTMSLSVAGHPRPIIVRRSGLLETIDCPGTALGLFRHLEFHDIDITLEPGDTALLYTDGLTEARTADGMFGEEGLHTVLRTNHGADASTLAREIERAVVRGGGENTRDDIALLVIRASPQRAQF